VPESQDEMLSPPDSPVTVLLVDDHAVVRSGYRRLLEHDPRLKVVGEASNMSEALRCDRELAPHVIVLDIALPRVSGIETLRRILRRRPSARILMFSMYDDGIYASRSLAEGALGYLSKASAPELLIEGVRTVAEGKQYISPDVKRNMSHLPPSIVGLGQSLSPREHEILQLLTHGNDAGAIVAQLGLSAKTVANLQSSLRQKLGADTTLQLIMIARQLGLG